MKDNRKTYRLLLAGLMLLTLLSKAQAQDSRVSLVVHVTDSSGAAVQGATVTVNQLDCQCGTCPPEIRNCTSACCDTRTNPPTCCIVAASATSNDEGTATLQVNPGKYRARIESANFKSATVDGIEVGVGQTNRVEVTLDPGISITDAVSVSKSRKALDTPETLKTLTVKLPDYGNTRDLRAAVTVIVKVAGCTCGECPAGKKCPLSCCDCKQGDCTCCIVARAVMMDGTRSFRLPPGTYDVIFKLEEESWGTFSGVSLEAKETKLAVRFSQRAL